MPDLSDHERLILDRARQIDTEDSRSKYLIEICGGDSEMLERIQNQLQSKVKKSTDVGDPTFTQTPPVSLIETCEFLENDVSSADNSLSGSQPGTIIAGRYELLKLIAEGGMGSVWVALQSEPVKRKVAIKLIKPGMDSHQVLARFDAERQALAVMDHPNIAKVFDGGLTDQERPFFVMEYVQGVSLTKYSDDEKLSVTERLKLFISICAAVQHAHQKGIIHRDLKPSNILVGSYDGQPTAKVIDFGLAKAMHQPLTEESMLTVHGMVLGTPLYMSPEQAEPSNEDIDTRTDIYSLGVILYELLTGTTPLERKQLKEATAAEMVRLIKEVEPPKPSTRLSSIDSLASIAEQRGIGPSHLRRKVSGDLDWVVMKALEKDRSRRYETANGFAADLRRHLDNDPVNASPPSKRYRMQKFIKRNRVGVIAASLVLVALILGIVGVSSGLAWALAEKEKTKIALAEKNTALQATRTTIDHYVDTIQNAELLKEPGFQPLLNELLKGAFEHYQQYVADVRDDDDQLMSLSTALFQLGNISRYKGEVNTAIDALEEVVEIRQELLAGNPTHTEFQFQLGLARTGLAHAYQVVGRNTESRALLRQTLVDFEILRELHPADLEVLTAIASCHSRIGRLEHILGNLDESSQSLSTHLELRELIAQQTPDDDAAQSLLAEAHSQLGSAYWGSGEKPKAIQSYQDALDIHRRLAEGDPAKLANQIGLASTYEHLASFLTGAADGYTSWKDITPVISEAIEYSEKALDIRRRLVAAYPNIPQHRDDLGILYYHTAGLLKSNRQSAKALELYDQCLAIFRTLANEQPTIVHYFDLMARSLVNSAYICKLEDRMEDALTRLGEAQEILQGLVDQHPEMISFHDNLARCWKSIAIAYRDSDQPINAMEAFSQERVVREMLVHHPNGRVLDIVQLGGNYVNSASAASKMATADSIASSVDDFQLAEELYDKGVETLLSALEKSPDEPTAREFIFNAYWHRALLFESLDRFGEAADDWAAVQRFDPKGGGGFEQRRLDALSKAKD